jgi:hypothetical protein
MPVPVTQIATYRILNQYFLKHVRSFGEVDARVKAHFDMKVRHTYNVVRNIQKIVQLEGFDEQTMTLAAIIALFHDIGRFRQFMDYGTFDDSISLNHAELSVRLLHDEGIDLLIPAPEMDIIIPSILQHNIPYITEDKNTEVILFSKLLRDADKIDIWKIQTETDVVYTIRSPETVNHYIIPDEIYQCFLENRIVTVDYARSLNDFRLLRLSWIYDMNFPATYGLLNKEDYASAILAKIPSSDRLYEISGIIRDHMHQHAFR